MKTLLRLDSSIRLSGSYTRTLTDYYERAWLNENPDGEVIHRCLVNDSIPHFTEEALENFITPYASSNDNTLSDRLIAELKKSDHLLIGSPLYNLSLPSSLKAYLDHVVRSTATFVVEDDHYRGLLHNTSATLITARSGISSADYVDDYQTGYLKSILNFIGIGNIEVISVEATGSDNEKSQRSISHAKRKIDDFFISDKEPEWVGSFSKNDKHEISYIRSAQSDAITNGDAERYAELCTDDIQLLIPSHDAISGIETFLKTEQALFASATFDSFIKYPIRIERSDNLAVEIGRQEVAVRNQSDNQGVFASSQKYMHVFRKTNNGWRFSVLMSNQSG
jgi:FMN-dependent NADH-azoreductase/ketosteroid isomerase-like protein